MPPDFGSPVAQNVNVDPNKGLTTISNLMGLQSQGIGIHQAQQNLETGESTQKSAQAKAQGDQQLMNERLLTQKAMMEGKDPDGNPLMKNGEADPVSMTKFANKFLPLSGNDFVQKIVGTMDTRLKLNDTNRALGQNYKNDIAGIIRSGIGDVNTPPASGATVAANIDAYIKQQGDNAPPQLAQSAQWAKSLLQTLGPGVPPQKANTALLHLSNQYEPTSAVAAQQASPVNQITTPAGAQQVGVNPQSPFGMGAIGPATGLGLQPGINPVTGQPYAVGGGGGASASAGGTAAPAGGGGASAGGASAGKSGADIQGLRPMPNWPTPQEAAQATAANERWTAVRQADSSPQTGYQATSQVYKNLLNILKTNPNIGPGSAGFNEITKVLTPFGASANTGYQEVSGYLDRLAGQNASTANATTNFSREQAANATGTTQFNNESLSEKLRFGASALEASHSYRKAVDAFTANAGRAAPYNQDKFDAAWTANADPIAFRMMAAHANGDTQDIAAIKTTPASLQHYRNLRDYLLQGKLPPK